MKTLHKAVQNSKKFMPWATKQELCNVVGIKLQLYINQK